VARRIPIVCIDKLDAPTGKFDFKGFLGHGGQEDAGGQPVEVKLGLFAVLYDRSTKPPTTQIKEVSLATDPEWTVQFKDALVAGRKYTLVVYFGEGHRPMRSDSWTFKAS
jgi:hypothetical protein